MTRTAKTAKDEQTRIPRLCTRLSKAVKQLRVGEARWDTPVRRRGGIRARRLKCSQEAVCAIFRPFLTIFLFFFNVQLPSKWLKEWFNCRSNGSVALSPLQSELVCPSMRNCAHLSSAILTTKLIVLSTLVRLLALTFREKIFHAAIVDSSNLRALLSIVWFGLSSSMKAKFKLL